MKLWGDRIPQRAIAFINEHEAIALPTRDRFYQ